MTTKKALCLMSGGFDSPVAMYLTLKRGVEVIAVHFDNQPFTDYRPLMKTKKLVKKIASIFNKNIKFYTINHGKNQKEIIANCNRRYQCVLCRRLMYKISEKIAEKEGCQFLITGENIGQVASQTLDNLKSIHKDIKIDVLRPILCNDKLETMNLAKEIGTYDLSAEQSFCCKATPKNPTTKARDDKMIEEEDKLDTERLIKESITNAKVEVIEA